MKNSFKRIISCYLVILLCSSIIVNARVENISYKYNEYTQANGIGLQKSEWVSITVNNAYIKYIVDAKSFNVGSVSITYAVSKAYENANISVHYDSLKSEAVAKLKLTSTGGFNNFVTQTLELPPFNGEKDIYLIFDRKRACNFKEATFGKIVPERGLAKDIPINYEDSQAAYVTMIRADSPVAIVNGAKRYIDEDSIHNTPYISNNEIYVPIDFAVSALGLTGVWDNDQFIIPKGSSVYKFTLDEKKYIINNNSLDFNEPMQKKDGTYFVPFAIFASCFEYSSYKEPDGILVVGDSEGVKDVSIDESYKKNINKTLTGYLNEAKEGKTYYVSQMTGNNSNSGTEEKPFATINYAAQIANAGDTVIIKEGVYREMITPKNSGKILNPITFKGAENEKVILSGTEIITDWKPWKGNIYKANTAIDLGIGKNQMFFDDKAIREARHPNADTIPNMVQFPFELEPLWATRGNIRQNAEEISKDQNNQYVFFSETDLNQETADYWKDAIFNGLCGEAWSTQSAIVESSQKGSIKVKDPSTYWWFSKENPLSYGYLSGTLNWLDVPGEWIVKDGEVYLYAPNGYNPNEHKIEMKKRHLLFDLRNLSYIHIEGIEGIGGSITTNKSDGFIIDKCKFSYISHFTKFDDARDGYIDNVKDKLNIKNGDTPPQRGEVAFWLDGYDIVIKNSIFYYSAGAALMLTGVYSKIENNIFEACGYAGTYLGGIFVVDDYIVPNSESRGGHIIKNNTLSKSGRLLLNIQNRDKVDVAEYTRYYPLDIAYNRFSNGGIMSGEDGSTINTYGISAGNNENRTKFRNNIISDNWAGGQNANVYWDSNSRFISCYENIMTQKTGLKLEYGGLFINYNPARKWITLVDEWANSILKDHEGGAEALKASDYPSGIPFPTGANFDINRNPVKTILLPIEKDTQGAIEAEKFDNSLNGKKDNMSAFLSGQSGWLEYKNVDFGNGKNRIDLIVGKEKYAKNEVVELRLNSPEGKLIGNKLFDIKSPVVDMFEPQSFDIIRTSGVHDLYIVFPNYKSCKIDAIRLLDTGVASKRIEAESFDNFYYNPNQEQPPRKVLISAKPCVNNTWAGNWIQFSDVFINETYNSLKYSWATSDPYAGNVCTLRKNSPDGEIIAQFTFFDTNGSWSAFQEKEVQLGNKLEPGVYDLFICFETEKKSANFDWIEFGM